MNNAILQHFKTADPILYAAIVNPEHITVTASETLFSDLCESIVRQQLSDKAATTIWNRFISLFPYQQVTPEILDTFTADSLRAIGTSWSKAAYVKNIAAAVLRQGLDLEQLRVKPDQDVIAALTAIKGIGKWTSEMFLMFSLGREDIFSFGDVGLQRAIQRMYKLKTTPTSRQMLHLSSRWQPYRTYACRVLWRSLDGE